MTIGRIYPVCVVLDRLQCGRLRPDAFFVLLSIAASSSTMVFDTILVRDGNAIIPLRRDGYECYGTLESCTHL